MNFAARTTVAIASSAATKYFATVEEVLEAFPIAWEPYDFMIRGGTIEELDVMSRGYWN